jgi:hypothetical protein
VFAPQSDREQELWRSGFSDNSRARGSSRLFFCLAWQLAMYMRACKSHLEIDTHARSPKLLAPGSRLNVTGRTAPKSDLLSKEEQAGIVTLERVPHTRLRSWQARPLLLICDCVCSSRNSTGRWIRTIQGLLTYPCGTKLGGGGIAPRTDRMRMTLAHLIV